MIVPLQQSMVEKQSDTSRLILSFPLEPPFLPLPLFFLSCFSLFFFWNGMILDLWPPRRVATTGWLVLVFWRHARYCVCDRHMQGNIWTLDRLCSRGNVSNIDSWGMFRDSNLHPFFSLFESQTVPRIIRLRIYELGIFTVHPPIFVVPFFFLCLTMSLSLIVVLWIDSSCNM